MSSSSIATAAAAMGFPSNDVCACAGAQDPSVNPGTGVRQYVRKAPRFTPWPCSTGTQPRGTGARATCSREDRTEEARDELLLIVLLFISCQLLRGVQQPVRSWASPIRGARRGRRRLHLRWQCHLIGVQPSGRGAVRRLLITSTVMLDHLHLFNM